MGYNTMLFIHNDAMHEIDNDPVGWWKKTKSAIANAMGVRPVQKMSHGENLAARWGERPTEYGFGNYANAFRVVSNVHADETVLITAGGNMAHVIGRFYTGARGPGANHHEVEGQAEIIRQWAEENGYSLVRKET